MGVKPLLRTLLPDGTLLFASEVKAFHAHPEFTARPDIDALTVRLAYEYPLDSTTLFLGVTQVAPGTIESWSLNEDGRAVLNGVSKYSRDIISPAEHDSDWNVRHHPILKAVSETVEKDTGLD
jgi:asparagine synthetase B (glutamine-hydrolysing)